MSTTFSILIADDDDLDADVLTAELLELDSTIRIQRARDGMECLDLLREKRVDLLLLDLRMPRVDGLEALSELKKDPALRGMPVVILSSSDLEADRVKCYSELANAYVVKPSNMQDMRSLAKGLVRFWVTTASRWRHAPFEKP